jgi:general L-amino acid transport system substrate-binding protein
VRSLSIAWIATVLVLLACWSPAEAGDTLRLVRARGALRCGVSEGVTGFSTQSAAGGWSGIDVDFCRAVAAAVLGDRDKVQFIPLRATARFPAIGSREIDILARNTTWSVAREAAFSIIFVGPLYFDSQALLVRADGKLAHGEALDGATVCVEKGTNEIDDLRAFSRIRGWQLKPIVASEFGKAYAAFEEGKCAMLADDRSAFAGMLAQVADPGAYVVRPEIIAKEPLGPAVRWDDGQWLAIVRAVYAALIDAEERAMTQADARAFAATKDAAHRSYLEETALIGRAFGLVPDWAVLAVASGGNYGEIFERNLGAGSPLKLDRGPNRPWTQGGLLYAAPFE